MKFLTLLSILFLMVGCCDSSASIPGRYNPSTPLPKVRPVPLVYGTKVMAVQSGNIYNGCKGYISNYDASTDIHFITLTDCPKMKGINKEIHSGKEFLTVLE